MGVPLIESELEAFWLPRGRSGGIWGLLERFGADAELLGGSARFIAIFWVMRGWAASSVERIREGASAARISCFGRFQTGCSAGSGTGCSTRGSGAGSGLSLSR